MIDDTLSVVFYDLTTIRTEGLSEQPNDLRRPGMSKEGIVAPQFLLGVVQTADGLPIHHEVFNGNASEGPTPPPVLKRVLQRFAHFRRLVLVADRGLLSLDNLKALEELALPDGALGPRKLEYILAVPGRRNGEFEPVLADLQVQVAVHAAQAAAFAYRFNRRFNLRDLVARLIVDVAHTAPAKEELVRAHAEACFQSGPLLLASRQWRNAAFPVGCSAGQAMARAPGCIMLRRQTVAPNPCLGAHTRMADGAKFCRGVQYVQRLWP